MKPLPTLGSILVILLISSMKLNGQLNSVKQVRLTDFDLQSSSLINSTGEEISTRI